jgi:hypothetical protein
MLPRVNKEQEAPAGILLGLCQSTSAIRDNLGAKLGFDALELGMP